MASPVVSKYLHLEGFYSREKLLEMKANGSIGLLESLINLRKPAQTGLEIRNGKVTVHASAPVAQKAPVVEQQIPTASAPVSAAPPTGVFQGKTVKKTGKKIYIEIFPKHHLSKKMPLIYSDAVLAKMSLTDIKKYLRGTLGFERGDIYLLKKPSCLKLIAWCKDHYLTYWATKS